ncbi:MAG: DHHA1 domain-containing protein, partial [Pirellulales bacterium]|nr:DHHA1 domain-containing protein [Pirellulales bacterium]
AVLFVELDEAKTKVSLRSKTAFDVQAIAAQFGGGGHRAAAGVSFPGKLDEARQQVLGALHAALR